jgi:hypothetical protein
MSRCGIFSIRIAVLESTRLRFVGIAEQVPRHSLGFGQKRPFQTGRKTGAASPAQARFFHFFHHFIGCHAVQRLFHRAVAAVFAIHLVRVNALNMGVFKQ